MLLSIDPSRGVGSTICQPSTPTKVIEDTNERRQRLDELGRKRSGLALVCVTSWDKQSQSKEALLLPGLV